MAAAQEPDRTPQDSQRIEFPQDSTQQKVGKWIGVIGGLLGIVVTIVGVPVWLLGEIDASAAQVEERVDKKLEEHGKNPHEDSVPREIYEQHVETQEKANDAAKEERSRIEKKLDLIGKETYRSPAKWERTLENEGIKLEEP